MKMVNLNKIDSNTISLPADVDIMSVVIDNFTYTTRDFAKVPFYKLNSKEVEFKIGFIEYLFKYLLMNNIMISNMHEFDRTSNLVVNKKWKDILDSDFRVVNGKNQYQVLSEILSFNRASAQIYTGYGKSEIELAIIESYMEMYPDKNVVHLVPGDAIKKEIEGRCTKWDVPVPEYHKFKSRYNLVNPVGFMKGKKAKSKDPALMEWMSNVGLVVGDEWHHVSAKSWIVFLEEYVNKYDYIYGFSGTLDSDDGRIPIISEELMDYQGDLIKQTGFTGIPKMVLRNNQRVLVAYLKDVFSHVPNAIAQNYTLCLNLLFKSKKLSKLLSQFLLRRPERFMYIPVHKVESGYMLANNMNEILGDHAVIVWSSGKYSHPDINTFEELKRHISTSTTFRALVSTSVSFEGVDTGAEGNELNTMFNAIGTSNRVTLQTKGRLSRGKESLDPLVLMPWDEGHNPIVNKQTRVRYRKLKQEHSNIKFVSMEDI